MNQSDFLRPRLRGERFKGAAIPLEMLRDLALLEEMVREVAKWVYLDQHQERSRCPRGFSDGLEFRLTGIEDGSAIPLISLVLVTASLPELPHAIEHYYAGARDAIVRVIAEAADEKTPRSLPPRYLAYFDRFGRSLRDGEAIEFMLEGRESPVLLSRATRKRLLEASKLQFTTEHLVLRGSIHAVDQDGMTFDLRLVDGKKSNGPIPEEYRETILAAFNGYRDGARVAIRCIARFSRSGRLESLLDVESVTILDVLDVPARVDELRALRDGWLEGHGRAPSKSGLDWFITTFEGLFDSELPLPYVFPTEEGGLRLEWELNEQDISLDIDLTTHRGDYHSLKVDGSDEVSELLELEGTDGWGHLGKLLSKLDVQS